MLLMNTGVILASTGTSLLTTASLIIAGFVYAVFYGFFDFIKDENKRILTILGCGVVITAICATLFVYGWNLDN